MHALSLLLSAVTLAQTPVAPSADLIRLRAELVRAQAEFRAAAPAWSAHLRASLAPQVAELGAAAPVLLAQAQASLAPQLAELRARLSWDGDEDPEPAMQAREPWAQQDPGDSLYRAAREALNRSRYAQAAERFRQLRERHPRSTYAPDAFYWEAFALYRKGETEDLRNARRLIEEQARRHPEADTHRDAEVLLRRVLGALARHGDAQAAAQIAEDVEGVAPAPTPTPRAGPDVPGSRGSRAARPPREPRLPRTPRPGRSGNGCDDDDDDLKVAALNALLQMDADRAVPILKAVLAKQDEGSACLRRKAVFLVSQKRSAETEDILLDAARSDPDPEVREQAVFWLSQVGTEKAVSALDSILRRATEESLQEKAIFALSQHRSPRAAAALRGYAERRDVPARIREQAIFWLGQQGSPETAEFLKTLYPTLDNDELKEKVLFSFSQMRAARTDRWLLDVALNKNESIELRKKALFWAGQGHAPIADLLALYDRTDAVEMREQLLFVYSQRREAQVVDKLLEIARSDPDRELRKKALFWLGQSRDPRVPELLLQIINQPEP